MLCVDMEPSARSPFLDIFTHITAHQGGEMEGDNLIIFETSRIIDGKPDTLLMKTLAQNRL